MLVPELVANRSLDDLSLNSETASNRQLTGNSCTNGLAMCISMHHWNSAQHAWHLYHTLGQAFSVIH